MSNEQHPPLFRIDAILKEYRDGARGLPTYDELAAILAQQPRVSINPAENAQLARDAQAIVDADVAALASGRTLGKGMSVFEQNAAMRAALDKIYHLRQIDWEPTRVCGIINQCIMAIGAPVAAPQVVADERAAFEAAMIKRHYPENMFDGFMAEGEWAYYDPAANKMMDGWQARAALAAAPVQDDALSDAYRALQNTLLVVPDGDFKRNMDDWLSQHLGVIAGEPLSVPAPVQAQEPVALLTLGGIDGGEYGDNDLELVSSKAVEKLQEQLVRGHDSVVLQLFAWPVPAAQVQPVAVPDGWKLVPDLASSGMMEAARYSFREYGHNWAKMYEKMLHTAPAAPAAQGDAKEMTDEQIKEVAINYASHVAGDVYDVTKYDCAEDFFNCVRAAIAAKAAS